MKTKLILGSLLALTCVAKAQWSTAGSDIYKNPNPNGNVGIGTTSPSFQLDIQTYLTSAHGLRVKHLGSSGGEASIRLDATVPGGREYGIHSIGNGWGAAGPVGSFMIRDEGAVAPRLLIDATGNVGIGTISPLAQLHVVSSLIGVRVDAGGTGVAGNGLGSGNVGVLAGIAGRASGGATNYGGYFGTTGSSSGVTSYGVYAEIFYPTAGGVNYGVYSTVGGNSGGSPNYNPLAMAGYFNGDVVTTSSMYYTSDKRLKKDILTINNSLGIINKLNPVTYNFDGESIPSMALPVEKQYGFLSQEVKEILPEMTKTIVHPAKLNDEGVEIVPQKEFLGLNYNGFIAILTKGIQEQQAQISDQQKQLDDQKQLIDALTQKSSGTTGINSINNPVETGFQMSQNEPNPFTHETVVKYTLPQTISNAFMAVYDLTGKQITTFPINEKGSSSITITSEKLAAGIYIYSIVADGKVIDSKRMIVAEK